MFGTLGYEVIAISFSPVFSLIVTYSLLLDIQTDDDEGLCRSLNHPPNGEVSPQTCTASISTYAKMTCTFTCDEDYVLEGSPKRVCMASGLWSGEPVKCHSKKSLDRAMRYRY